MIAQLLKMVQFSLKSPKEGAEMVLAAQPTREILWTILVVVVAVTVLLAQAMNFIVPPPPEAQELMPFSSSPLMFALVMWGLLVLMVFCTHYIGQMFGGEGAFNDSLVIVIWLQTILIVIQVVQIVIALLSPGLAALLGFGFALFSIWIFVNFVAVAHGFKNLGLVLFGIIMSMIGVVLGLSLIFVFIAILFGVDLPNG
ncbi:Yip1 family protein [uncultured Litoreibacter sp.]|uniref:Yip1 family protein n=1 Tax=uncultured Litoreibacter sp. TaxID=1392394 RepID=UPI0026018050|nr:Yip1 family protein [uncultured Litoreibacter sp.]